MTLVIFRFAAFSVLIFHGQMYLSVLSHLDWFNILIFKVVLKLGQLQLWYRYRRGNGNLDAYCLGNSFLEHITITVVTCKSQSHKLSFKV